jgi:ubiquinone biosynthesis protein
MIDLIRIITIISLYRLGTSARLGKLVFCFAKIYEIILIPFRCKKHRVNRLVNCLYDLGPIYVKFGQALSTRPDIIGDELADSLRGLQDNLPPFAFSKVRTIIEASFRKKLEEIFAKFDEVPIAAASISQVHKGVLHNGHKVAIKVLRPEIHKLYSRDIKLLKFLARFSLYIVQDASRLKPFEIVKSFENTMHQELDFMLEAASASEMRDNAKNDHNVLIPKVYWEFTSADILTTEWVDGISIYDKSALEKAGLDVIDISSKIAVMFFNQAYRDGVFHADLHPGNVFVCKDGRIALVDFGIIGRLPEKDRLAVAEILHAFIKRDYVRVAQIHIDVGYVPADTDLGSFAQSCRAIGEPIVGMAAKEILAGKLFTQLFKMTRAFGMETQPQLLMIQKTTVVVEGIGRMLNPDMNLWKLAEPWIKKWAIKNISPEAKVLRLMKKVIGELAKKFS